MPRRPRAGFSVLEICAAIGIITAGTIILASYFRHVRDVARQTCCVSNVKQLALAMRMYAEDADGRMPPGVRPGEPLMAYIRNTQILICPSQPDTTSSGFGEPPYKTGYLCNPGVRLDDLPSAILIGDDTPNRHAGKRWIGARLDCSVFVWPAEKWEGYWGRMVSDE